jgi:outer membrane protein assembly factor BamB
VYVSGLYAINPDGTLKFQGPGGDGVAPAIGADGTIYSIGDWPDDKLYALDPADGGIRWSFELGETTYGSPTVGADGTIFVGGGHDVAHLFAVTPNGTQKWAWDGSPSTCWIESSAALSPSGDVYFQHNCLGLVALDPSGNETWTQAALGSAWNSPSVGPDGTIYLGGSSDGFTALDPDGAIEWSVPLDNWMYLASSAVSADGSTIYRGDNGGAFYAFDSSGSIKWTYDSGTDCYIFSAPVLTANGIVYFANGCGYVYALRAENGAFLWRYRIGNLSNGSPAVGADGTLYVLGTDEATGNAALYAFRCADGICDVGLPGAPSGVSATAGDGQVTVGWTAPASSGGSAITGYVLTPFVGASAQASTTVANVTSATVGGLTNGTTYTFTVAATSAFGTGPPSAASNAVTPVGLPGAPTNVRATAGDGMATVSFTPPSSDGGAPIVSYTVTATPGGQSVTTSGRVAWVTGLTNGTSYTFTVTATNAAGTGSASAPSTAVVPVHSGGRTAPAPPPEQPRPPVPAPPPAGPRVPPPGR